MTREDSGEAEYDSGDEQRSLLTRRNVVMTAAWTVPVVTIATAAPAFAYGANWTVSGTAIRSGDGTNNATNGTNAFYGVFNLTLSADGANTAPVKTPMVTIALNDATGSLNSATTGNGAVFQSALSNYSSTWTTTASTSTSTAAVAFSFTFETADLAPGDVRTLKVVLGATGTGINTIGNRDMPAQVSVVAGASTPAATPGSYSALTSGGSTNTSLGSFGSP